MKKLPSNNLSAILLLFGFFLLSITSCRKEIKCTDCNKKPIAIAGPDQTITLPSNITTLDGSSSKDPDGTITNFQWSKISGPDTFNLRSPNTTQTNVDSLHKGIYQFELKVTDNSGLSGQDTIMITVNAPNRPPVADAGPDQTMILPATATFLNGSYSADPDNNIVSYKWRKISGPSSFSIANINTVQTDVSVFSKGVYLFELKVTDVYGLFDMDTVQIEVKTETSQLYYGNVCFYFPDPTGTIPPVTLFLYRPEPGLITVTINNVSGTLSGVWDSNSAPRCPIESDYYVEPGETCLIFDLPPGTYNWKAQSNICNLNAYPGITAAFSQYFLTSRSTSGTITVNPGYNCILQRIAF